MDRAFGAEAEAFLLDRDVAGIAAVEILAECFDDAGADARAQRFADVEFFPETRNGMTISLALFTCPGPCCLNARNSPGRRVNASKRLSGRLQPAMRSGVRRGQRLLFAPALHRGGNSHRLAILGDGAARDVDAAPRAACRRWCRRTARRLRLSASISCLMRWRTASAECASPPSEAAIDEVKKYFSSKMPRLVAMYLLAVTRDTVDFVHADRVRDGLAD